MFSRIAIPLLLFLAPRYLPHLLRFARLVWRLSFDRRVPILLRILLPVAIVYAVSPFDLVPDRVPILGRFDDLIVLGFAMLLLTKLAPKHVVDEHLGIQPANPRPQEEDPAKVVEGSAQIVEED